jgi:hypothetical protein
MTHIKYEDLKLALEALESTRIIDFSVEDIVSWKKAITAFKQALATQPAPVQPVKRIEATNDTDCAYAYADGWNACVEHHKYIAKNAPEKGQP